MPTSLVLAFKQDHVLPHQPVRVVARPAKGAFAPQRFFMSGAGSGGDPSEWTVNDIDIDGKSQLIIKDLPGALFSSHGIGSPPRSTTLTLNNFDTVERGRELAITVTYTGPHKEGVSFYASCVGGRPAPRPTVIRFAPERHLYRPKTTLTLTKLSESFLLRRLEISPHPGDWLVYDLRVNGQSLFTSFGGGGPIPGDMFASDCVEGFVKFIPCPQDGSLEIDVGYDGPPDQAHAELTAILEGTVAHDDSASPPPDLHATLEVEGQRVEIVGTCNWRPPAESDHEA